MESIEDGVGFEDVLSVDLGGTSMRAAVVTTDGSIRARCRLPTDREVSGISELRELVSTLNHDGVRYRPSSAVVGVPGRVDYETGRLEYAPNLPASWARELSAENLSATLGLPVSLANDGDMAAVGEAYFGAGASERDVVYVTFSTGVGAGVVLGGRLVRGRRSLAEIGHTILSRDSFETVEMRGSGTAMEREAHRAGLSVGGEQLLSLVRSGDPVARAVWQQVVAAISQTVVNLAHLFSPSVVVVGGGVGRNFDLLEIPIREALRSFGPRQPEVEMSVRVASLGDDAGLAGAAAWNRAIAT